LASAVKRLVRASNVANRLSAPTGDGRAADWAPTAVWLNPPFRAAPSITPIALQGALSLLLPASPLEPRWSVGGELRSRPIWDIRPPEWPRSRHRRRRIIRLSISSRRKLTSILLAVAVFALLAGLTTGARGRPVVYGVLNAIIVGGGVGLFEQFYVRSRRGRWLREMHPIGLILVYLVVVVAIFFLAIHLTRLVTWNFSDLPTAYRLFLPVLPIIVGYSLIGIVVMRAAHFIGVDTLFHLIAGTYHRPVVEKKVLMFLDINDSTGLSARLGAIETKSLVGKFLFDISAPITDNGGEIYLYKGDGLIALWSWEEGTSRGRILRAIDAVFAAVEGERAEYLEQFGLVPAFRIGVHGGEVVVSEQGDIKRSIGIYGNTINLAARMEDAAKAHGVLCVISGDVAEALPADPARLAPIGHERLRGTLIEMPIFEYRVAARAAPPADLAARRRRF
jgi:class 3 adenylate cyclase